MGSCNCRKKAKPSPCPTVEPSKESIFSLQQSIKTTNTVASNRSTTPSSLSLLEGRKVVVAIYNYVGLVDDISFSKGDRMLILDDSEKDWYFVKHFQKNKKGYIPKSYVEDVKSIAKEDWYFDKISRREAERLLLANNLFLGTFLVRECDKENGSFCLSVRFQDSMGTAIVCHYRIKIHTDDDRIYIHHNERFPTLQDLINYYMINAHDICHRLVVPCEKPQPDLPELDHCMTENWDINPDDLLFVKLLGCGKYGEVYLGKWLEYHEVAIKILKEGTMTKQAFIEEAQIMRMCKHDNLVRLYAICSKKEQLFMIMEYMNRGSLNEYLQTGMGRNLTVSDLIDILGQIANGMSYLEAQAFIHRDLSCRNVLIKENNRVKIADFGLARIVQALEYSSPTGDLPLKWSAIESVQEGIFTTKSDVWSFGIVGIEIFTYGDIPYKNMPNTDLIEALLNGYREPKPANCPNSIYSVILQCWSLKPENRPTFKTIYSFLADYNVIGLDYKEIND